MQADLYVFGDSIAYGAFDTVGGWVQRIRAKIDSRNITEDDYWVYLANVSISGNTSTDLLERFEIEYLNRKSDDEQIFIFAIGINDSYVFNETGEPIISLEQYKNNLSSLYDATSKYGNKIAFVGLTPVDESKVNPVPWRTEISYFNSSVAQYNAALKEFAATKQVPFIDMWQAFNELNYTALLSDGLHPNNEGHELMAAKIEPLIKSWGLLT